MIDILRQELTASASPLVVKVGTRVLTQSDGTLCEARIASLAHDVHQLMNSGRQVVLVSSGAVGAGMSALGLDRRPSDLARLQAVAAVGQAKLMEVYDRALREHDRHAGQLLLTANDLQNRDSYLNVRNTLISLLDMGVVPIVNENDSVAVEELMRTFGDNDRLAALVTNLLRAPLLVILSDVEGLYDGPPEAPTSQLISTVNRFDASITGAVQDHQSSVSKGGMASKLEAAKMCTFAGENVILAKGSITNVLQRIVSGEPLGTAFLAQGKSVSPWKRWIGYSARSDGSLVMDEGACRAVVRGGRSLLAIGICEVAGQFKKGDVVTLRDQQGQDVARGLTNYDSTELRRIMGLHSDRIAEELGHCPYVAVVHRDNLALVEPDSAGESSRP